MKTAQPRIGMDRYISAEWMDMAASVVRGEMLAEGLHDRLANEIPGRQVQLKAIGIINRMWFPNDNVGQEIAASAARLVANGGGDRIAAFEAVAIGNYPYFRQVVETVGRLLRLQETCSPGEVHRRMFEQHGKRTTISQATSYAFKTLVSWGMIDRISGRRLSHAAPLDLTPAAKRILDLAANRSRASVTPLPTSDPLLFAFRPSGRT